jgi:hypothetical protein
MVRPKRSDVTPIQNLRLSQAHERSSYALSRRLQELFSNETEFLYGNLSVSNTLSPGIWNNTGVYTTFFRNLVAGSNNVDTFEKFNDLLLSLLQFLTNDMNITIENYTRQSIGNLQKIVDLFINVKFIDNPSPEFSSIILEYKQFVKLIETSLKAFKENKITNLILQFDTMMYTFLIAKIHSKLIQINRLIISSQALGAFSSVPQYVNFPNGARRSGRSPVSQQAQSVHRYFQSAQPASGGVSLPIPMTSINASGFGPIYPFSTIDQASLFRRNSN